MAVTDSRKLPRILLTISKPTYALKCVSVYYTQRIPPTRFGHSCAHLHGSALQRIDKWKYYIRFEPMHGYFNVSILCNALLIFYIWGLYEASPLV